MMKSLKEKVYEKYVQILQDKEDIFRDMIDDLTQDSLNDSKSSAGDKHETAISMMQLEQERLSSKLKEVLGQKSLLQTINPKVASKQIGVGTMVKTKKYWFFISQAMPKIEVEGQIVYAISPESPLAIKLKEEKIGSSFVLNNSEFEIEMIE